MAALTNHRHELFAQGLVEGKSADQAYTDAGYKPGRNNAARLRANESIQTRIEELQSQALKRHDITVDRIIEEYAKIAFSDIRKIFDAHGNLKLLSEFSDDLAGAISGLEIVTTQKGQGEVENVAKIKMADKRSALDSIGKLLNMFTEDVTIKAEVVQKTVSDLELARRLAFLMEKGAFRLKVG
jgi:phage terminase small subunit